MEKEKKVMYQSPVTETVQLATEQVILEGSIIEPEPM